MIHATKPFLPPKERFAKYVDQIWERAWLTNHGPLINELEERLKAYLEVPHLLCLNNGTLALQIAIRALDLGGEIITTPFSFVATTTSILWENCKPVFVDVEEKTLNIDPSKIEAAITEQTTAILATHVYGNPCDIDAITEIARKHGLKVIYDAAHCFGTKYKGKSAFQYGDVSTASFHATKLFHTTEGGAVFTPHESVHKRMSLLRNFGFTSPTTFDGIGVNGKNSEFHAAMGLCVLEDIDAILERRKQQYLRYQENLKGTPLSFITIQKHTVFNYAYLPIFFETEPVLLKAIERLNNHYVYPRRYFYPSLNTLEYVGAMQSCPVSEDMAKRVLTLPLFHDLRNEDIDMICKVIKESF